jgi:NAD+ synthase
MLTLYHIAQANDLLVCGTGNKVEDFGVGFFTKHGDGGVDISPIGDLMKSEVYELGTRLGVGEKILEATPTDGLWTDGRSDEDQLGITYDEAEWAMRVDYNKIDPKMLDPISERTYKIYKEWHTKNSHKMKPIPVCTIPRH